MVTPINGTVDAYGIPTPPAESGIEKTVQFDPAGTPTESCNAVAVVYKKPGVLRYTEPGLMGCSDMSLIGEVFRWVLDYLLMLDWLAVGKLDDSILNANGAPFSQSILFTGAVYGTLLTIDNDGLNNPRSFSVIVGYGYDEEDPFTKIPLYATGAITPGRTQIQTAGGRALLTNVVSSSAQYTMFALSRPLPTYLGTVELRAEIGDPIEVPKMLPGRRLYAAGGSWTLDGCVNDRRDWNNSIGKAADIKGVTIDAGGRHWYCRKLSQVGVLASTYSTPCRQVDCPFYLPVTTDDIWKPNVGDWLKIWLGKGLGLIQKVPSDPTVYMAWGAEKFPGLFWQAGMAFAYTKTLMRERESPYSGYWGYLRDRSPGEDDYPFKQLVTGAVAGIGAAIGGIAGVLEQTPASPAQSTVDGAAWADGTDAALAHLTTLSGIRELGWTGGFMADGAGGDCEGKVQRPILFDVVLRGIDLSAGAVDTVQTFFRGHKAIHRASGAVEIYLARETTAGTCTATVYTGSIDGNTLTLDLAPNARIWESIAGEEQITGSYLQGGLYVNPPQSKKVTSPQACQWMGNTLDLFRRGYVCWFPGLTGGLQHIRIPVITAEAYGGASYSGPPIAGVAYTDDASGLGFPTDFNDWRLDMDRLTLDLSGAQAAALSGVTWEGLQITGAMAGLLAPTRGGELTVKHIIRSGAKTVLTSEAISFDVDESNSDTDNGLWTLLVSTFGWDIESVHDIRIAGTRLEMRKTFPAELLTGLEAAVRQPDTMGAGIDMGNIWITLVANPPNAYAPFAAPFYGLEPEDMPWTSFGEYRPAPGQGENMLWLRCAAPSPPISWCGWCFGLGAFEAPTFGATAILSLPTISIPGHMRGYTLNLIKSACFDIVFTNGLFRERHEVDGDWEDTDLLMVGLNATYALITIESDVITAVRPLGSLPIVGLIKRVAGDTTYHEGTIDATAVVSAIIDLPIAANQVIGFLPTAGVQPAENTPSCLEWVKTWLVATSGTSYGYFDMTYRGISFGGFGISNLRVTIDQDALAAAAPRQTEPWPSLVNAE